MRHGAKYPASARLCRLVRLLGDGKPHSSMEIIRKARTANAATTVADLRDNGAEIVSSRERIGGRTIHYYTMTKGPTA